MKEHLNEQVKIALERATANLASREQRKEQLQMCQFLRRYLDYAKDPGHSALVEAGTGVGKSYGYLIATCEWLTESENKDNKVVIATNTINLQEQLASKDIPQIKTLYPELSIEKAKGRNNYICLRKLHDPESDSLFTPSNDKFGQILQWLETPEGKEGDKADLTFKITNNEWSAVRSDTIDCYGPTCQYYKKCYYNLSQIKLKKADIIVTTHAMVLTNYVNGGGLPEYTHLVLDEAHNFGRNATSIMTVQIGRERFQYLINMSNNQYCKAVFRKNKTMNEIRSWQTAVTNFSELFFQSLNEGRLLEPQENEYGEMLLQAINQIIPRCNRVIEDKSTQPINKTALINLANESCKLARELDEWLHQPNIKETVYWVENNTICYVPIEIGKMLKPLWSNKNTILTSATLCVAKRFDMIKETLNLPYKQTYSCRLESPFNFKENGLIYIPPQAISPKSSDYINYVTQTTLLALEKTGGKTFILFTSYTMLREVGQRLSAYLGDKIIVLEQGSDSRERLLRTYRENKNAILLGTDTYWEGVDEEIDCVILTKLPFAVPTTPVEEARYESMKNKGLNPFITYSLPQCALKMKQGTGRLIRRQGKRGIIVICDPRINQNWGKQIIQTLPDMKWTQDDALMDSYLNSCAI